MERARRDKYLITCQSRHEKKLNILTFLICICRNHAYTILDLDRNTSNDLKNPQDSASSQNEMYGLGFDRGAGGWKANGRHKDHLRFAQQHLKNKFFIFLDLKLRRATAVDNSTSSGADALLKIHFAIRFDWDGVSVGEECIWHPGRV